MNYQLLKQKRTSEDLGMYETYGIVLYEDGVEVARVSDVVLDEGEALKITETLNKNEVSIIHFYDVIQDLLN